MYFENNDDKSARLKTDANTFITGSSDTFNINDTSDLKVNILATSHFSSNIWGQIKDEDGTIINKAFVRLVKAVYSNHKIEYIDIAKCISDENGFYHFNLNPTHDDSSYKIIVSKIHTETLA